MKTKIQVVHSILNVCVKWNLHPVCLLVRFMPSYYFVCTKLYFQTENKKKKKKEHKKKTRPILYKFSQL